MEQVSEMLPFLAWWQEVNSRLFWAGKPDMRHEDARYWHDRQHSPETAARLHIEELEA